MSRGNTKIDKCWIISVVRGALSLIAGLVFVLCNTQRINLLTTIMAVAMAILLVVDVIEIIFLKKAKKDIKFPAINTAMELIMVNLLFATLFPKIGETITYGGRVFALGIYIVITSMLTIISAFKKQKISFDRLSLSINGLVGVIVGFVMILGRFYSTTYIMLLGLIFMVNGLTKFMLSLSNKKGEK